MRRKQDFFSRIGERLGLPREGLPGGFSAFLSGAGEVTVRGCRRILRYEPEMISLSVGKRELSVHGTGLICTAYSAETVTVTGDIAALTLSPIGGETPPHGVKNTANTPTGAAEPGEETR